ncbi:MAG: hypothetical protein COB45_01725 [Gammaproteobacteria bacterium]|nr:MAG: hypothetical protein COB45_01725 [Gammaproteobacteria bacterium]
MNIHLTLDYELFFGLKSGTVQKCIIEPTQKLLTIVDKYDIKVTFYVDIGYLATAFRLGVDTDNANLVIEQLQQLNKSGHDLQLHIHPHWEDAKFIEGKWVFDMARYKLVDFSKEQASKIISRYVGMFEQLNLPKPIAYRGGGWCIQPFDHIQEALKNNGIKVDSTVYAGGKNSSSIQGFDFRGTPQKNSWRFSENPLKVDDHGDFYELPIADVAVTPFFYWKFVFVKKMATNIHKAFGDGIAVAPSKNQILKMLIFPSKSVASIDGYKSILLNKAFKYRLIKFGVNSDFVLIGHPKAFTKFSLEKIASFIDEHSDHKFLTVSGWYNDKKSN